MIRTAVVAASLWVVANGAGAAEAKAPAAQSPLVRALADCRLQAEESARLRCLEAAAAALIEASANGQVVLVTREDVRKTRKSLFGFSLPKLPFFGGDDSAGEQQEEITATIAWARALPHGKWQMKLEGGGLWETTETSMGGRDPRKGADVVIKRGVLGSYVMRVGGQRWVRVKRVG